MPVAYCLLLNIFDDLGYNKTKNKAIDKFKNKNNCDIKKLFANQLKKEPIGIIVEKISKLVKKKSAPKL